MRRKFLVSTLVVFVVAAAVFAGWNAWRLWRPAQLPQFVDLRLGETRLRVHTDYIRPGDLAARTFERLDLTARFPDFAPAAAALPGDPGVLIYLRLQPRDQSLDPQERTAKLYARFLEQDSWRHPGGLIMRRFETASPYEREDLYFAPPEGRAFAARCMRPVQPPDGLPNTCITELRHRSLDVQIRFSPDHLPQWEKLVEGALGLVESMAR